MMCKSSNYLGGHRSCSCWRSGPAHPLILNPLFHELALMWAVGRIRAWLCCCENLSQTLRFISHVGNLLIGHLSFACFIEIEGKLFAIRTWTVATWLLLNFDLDARLGVFGDHFLLLVRLLRRLRWNLLKRLRCCLIEFGIYRGLKSAIFLRA